MPVRRNRCLRSYVSALNALERLVYFVKALFRARDKLVRYFCPCGIWKSIQTTRKRMKYDLLYSKQTKREKNLAGEHGLCAKRVLIAG